MQKKREVADSGGYEDQSEHDQQSYRVWSLGLAVEKGHALILREGEHKVLVAVLAIFLPSPHFSGCRRT